MVLDSCSIIGRENGQEMKLKFQDVYFVGVLSRGLNTLNSIPEEVLKWNAMPSQRCI